MLMPHSSRASVAIVCVQVALWLVWERKGGILYNTAWSSNVATWALAIFVLHLALGDIWNGEPQRREQNAHV